MDVTQAPSTIAAATQVQTNSTASARTAISSDFETFLRMLATQLQNQDPLNPIDSADYAVQLATFSSVEQQVKTNELLEGLVAQQSLAGLQGYSSWIGLEARSAAPVHFDGSTPVEIVTDPPAGTDRAVLVVKSAAGTVVSRVEMPTDPGSFAWAGLTEEGRTLPAGTYSLTLETYAEGVAQGGIPVEAFAQVIEARNSGGTIELVLRGDIAVTPAEVAALRDPG
ncbi:flagellar hook capping FlgD N-terminal domain-containing protein [Pseudooceanicola sp. LIPI14-2-Ac024]|uniref:flagellar hook capping FlgD N-terminal domain-containing protein n=1 Tax=Pseudooceanicola sp. LIPI14-2-Ac024 TaxID=3344875 RepID=UPI0035CF92BC